jgi:chromate transporter
LNSSRPCLEVFTAFLRLGLTSFGGPIAHLGYFRTELVLRRRWIDEAGYADLVALCQFLPGPASSQVGFALGVIRAGRLAGGLAAWAGFTLPSALVLLGFALVTTRFSDPSAVAFLHGLKLVAVAVVAQAVWGMARSLAPDGRRAGIALAAMATVLLLPESTVQVSVIGVAALFGLLLCRDAPPTPTGELHVPVGKRGGACALLLFAALLLLPLILPALFAPPAARLFDAFYRSGALVFGGGHVVLPLLQSAVVSPGWVNEASFTAGYGLTQAMPGPLFTFAAYLGAIATPLANPLAGAAITVLAIFLPGLLLVYGVLPFWDGLRRRPGLQAAMRGANAAVVGILGAALYTPVWTSAVLRPGDVALAVAGFLLLTVWRVAPWIMLCLVTAGAILAELA